VYSHVKRENHGERKEISGTLPIAIGCGKIEEGDWRLQALPQKKRSRGYHLAWLIETRKPGKDVRIVKIMWGGGERREGNLGAAVKPRMKGKR